VGKIFVLNCEGPWPHLKSDSVELRLDKEQQYTLKLLKFEFTSPTQAQLTVTSYKAGEHLLKAVQVVDAENSVVLGDLKFTVNSVLDPQNPPKEPIGPAGPLGLRLPIWYPLTLALIVLAVAGVIFYRWRLRRQKMKLLAGMRLNEYAQDPFFQFYQSARKMQRNYAFFSGAPMGDEDGVRFAQELDQAFKVYLARVFQIPTLAWSERKILADLKRNWPDFHAEFRLEIRKDLAELSRAMKAGKAITVKDCQQLFELLRKRVDQINAFQKARGGK